MKFDCVEMKRQAQERLLVEFEARKSEFSSYLDFIKKRPRKLGLTAR